MTNVRVLQSIFRSLKPSAAVSDERPIGGGRTIHLRASGGLVSLALMLMLVTTANPAAAQTPSGSAGGSTLYLQEEAATLYFLTIFPSLSRGWPCLASEAGFTVVD